jgi:glycerophosphoryl diester phosphodiesterase
MIIAHRGGYKDSKTKENSLDAFKWQIKENYADLLELDVHISKDSKIMVNHDASLVRTFPGRNETVDSLSASELEKIGIPTLRDVLEACMLSKKMKKKIVLIEIKPRKFSFLSGPVQLYPMENQLVQLIEEYEQKGVRSIVQTFFKDYLTNICKLSSRIECHLLAVAHVPSPCCGISLHFGAELFSLWRRNDLAALKREGISALNIHKAFCTASFVKSAHKVGLKVFIWTVDDVETAKQLITMNVDGIITNVPALLSGALSND